MRMRTVLVTLMLILFASGTVSADTVSLRSPSVKDPFLAGMLSWMMPGAGQIYAHSYSKGSLLMLGNLVDKTSLVLLVLYLNNNYSQTGQGNINWNQMKDIDKAFLIGYALLSSAFKIYNTVDAVYTAKKFNERVGVSIMLNSVPESGSLSLSMGVSFRLKGF